MVADETAQAIEARGSVPDPMIGTIINDRFRILSLLARGGMGKVYRAEQVPLGREVALKILSFPGDDDPQADFQKRFLREASALSKLTHPNTITVFDYGMAQDDVCFIAMELLEGRTLQRYVADEGPLPAAKVTHIARQICRSLREAHALGIVHRDLKPANVFLVTHAEEQDFVKVLDFGLVEDVTDNGDELKQNALFLGSPRYVSPEQIEGDCVDGRADVYSLGAVMYEMLTGHAPFERGNTATILFAHVHEDVPPMATHRVAVPHGLEQLVRRSMAKAPVDRFATMDEMIFALDNLTTDPTEMMPSGSLAQWESGPDPALDSLGGLASRPDAPGTGRGGSGWLMVALLVLSLVAFGATIIRSRARLPSGDPAPATGAPYEPQVLPVPGPAMLDPR